PSRLTNHPLTSPSLILSSIYIFIQSLGQHNFRKVMRPMIVGFMRNFRKPSYLAKLVAVVSKYQGIELIYLRPSDVNVKKGTVNGRMFIDNSWVSVEVPLPKFIDISPYCFKQ